MARVTDRELRRFGLMVGGIFAVIALWPLLRRAETPHTWAAVIAAALVAGGLLVPAALRPLYGVWMRIGEALGWVNTRLILGVTYFLVITPIGLLMRLRGHDPLDRRLADRDSYWIRRSRPADPRAVMERRF